MRYAVCWSLQTSRAARRQPPVSTHTPRRVPGPQKKKTEQENPILAHIKTLIAKLDDDDPWVRRDAQKKLIELGKKRFEDLVKIAKKELTTTKTLEVKRRLKEVLLALTGIAWEELPEAPIAGRYSHTAILWSSKLVIWGGYDPRRRDTFDNGAILDLKRLKLIEDLVGD